MIHNPVTWSLWASDAGWDNSALSQRNVRIEILRLVSACGLNPGYANEDHLALESSCLCLLGTFQYLVGHLDKKHLAQIEAVGSWSSQSSEGLEWVFVHTHRVREEQENEVKHDGEAQGPMGSPKPSHASVTSESWGWTRDGQIKELGE